MVLVKGNPEKPNIHQEIEGLEEKVLEKRKVILKEKSDIKDRDIIKEALKEKLEELKRPKEEKPVISSPAVHVVKNAQKIKDEKREKQIKLLVDLAFEKGIVHATEVAKKLNDPYLLDEFHDALVDEFYSYLVEQGKLEEI